MGATETVGAVIALGPWRLEAVVGVGGAGEVWRGAHVEQGVPVAVKVITAPRARDPRYRDAFADEVRSMAGLDHPGVVHTFDAGEVDMGAESSSDGRLVAGSPYVAMELAAGSLRSRPLPTNFGALRDALRALLDALGHAHAAGVIHRDIKPGNVLVFDEGTHVRLADFGLAHAMERERAFRGTAGTPAFMAPEQVRGEWRSFGPWTDLYAIGAMAFALVCGEPPFKAATAPELMRLQVHAEPPPLRPRFTVPAELESWVFRLMAKEPMTRFLRAADAAAALEAMPDVVDGGDTAAVITRYEGDTNTPTGDRSTTRSLSNTRNEGNTPVPRRRRWRPKGEVRLHPRRLPDAPESWRSRLVEAPSIRIVGAGLGLYGLRAVPLVGRVPERDKMWRALRNCREHGDTRVIVLRGTAGTGKSRLAEWIARRADALGQAVVLRAPHTEAETVGSGLARMVRAAVGGLGCSREELRERINTWLHARNVDDEYERRGLLELVWPAGEEEQHGVTVRFGSANERYALIRRLLIRVGEPLDDTGERRPVVLWIDDTQWATDALGLVDYLLEQVDGELPLLVVLTAREEALAERAAELKSLTRLEANDDTTVIQLGPLDVRERTELVQELLHLDGPLAVQVEERTGGNPLFAVQLVGDWVQRGVLEVGETGFVLRQGEQAVLPDDIHALWASRIKRTVGDEQERRALQIAALLGTDVDLAEWRGACSVARLRIPERLVPSLVAGRLAAPRRGGFVFAHEMLRESLARSVVEDGVSAELHDACANVLQIRFDVLAMPGLAERVGRHMHAAGRHGEALAPLSAAADERRAMSDYTGALRLLDLVDDTLRELGVAHDDSRGLRSQVDRASLLVGLGRLEDAEQVGRRAAARSGHHQDLRAAALRHVAIAIMKRGRLAEAEQLLELAEAAATDCADQPELARCLLHLGDVTRLLGRRREAEHHTRRALGTFTLIEDRRGQADAHTGLAAISLASGDLGATETHVRSAVALFESIGSRFGVAGATNTLGDALRASGDLDGADEAYRRAEALLRSLGSPEQWVPQFNLGLLHLARGQYGEAKDRLGAVLKVMRKAGRRGLEGALHAALLPCEADCGDFEAFDRHLARAEELLRTSGFVDADVARAAAAGADLADRAGQTDLAGGAWALAATQWRGLGDEEAATRCEQRGDERLDTEELPRDIH